MANKTDNSDKEAAKKKVLSSLNKKYGEGTIINMSESSSKRIDVIPTGSIGLDIALGRGGYPRGRISELVGFESSGKSSLALHAAAECQKLEGNVAYVDTEHCLSLEYAERIGVNTDALVVSQPDSGEQALQIVEDLVRSNAFDMVVVDSVAALVPQTEIEGEMGKPQMGSQARLMSQAMRKLVPVIGSSNCALLMINQYRQKIGVLYGPSEQSSGGNALRFAASVRVELRKSKAIMDGKVAVGNIVTAKVIKNKIASPFKRTTFNLVFGEGIDRFNELFTFGVNSGLIDKAGAWYSYKGERIGQGADNSKEWFLSHPDAMKQLEINVYECLNKSKGALMSDDDVVETSTNDTE